jgi:hypothetical protein
VAQIVAEVGASMPGVKVVPPAAPAAGEAKGGAALKPLLRVLEQAALRPDEPGKCDTIVDVVCDRLVAPSADAVARLLHAFVECPAIVVLDIADRFDVPAVCGWRDVLVHYRLRDDATAHVCEVQLVHALFAIGRRGLSHADIVSAVRSANELLMRFGLGVPTIKRQRNNAWGRLMAGPRKDDVRHGVVYLGDFESLGECMACAQRTPNVLSVCYMHEDYAAVDWQRQGYGLTIEHWEPEQQIEPGITSVLLRGVEHDTDAKTHRAECTSSR